MRTTSPTALIELMAVSFAALLVISPFPPAIGSGGAIEIAAVDGTVDRPDSTQIDSCTVISESGKYALSDDIEDTPAETCIRVRADDVVLDGRGHVLASNGNGGSDGLLVRQSTNVTVRNLSVTKWETGIHFENTVDGTVRNVVAIDNRRTGICLEKATSMTLTNITAADNVAPELSPFPRPSQSAGVLAIDSRNTRLSDANVSRNVGGISFVGSTDIVVSNSVATANEIGFFLRGANDTVRGSVAAGNNVGFFADNATGSSLANVSAVSNRVGFGVENTTNARLNDANASSNFLGISVVRSHGVSMGNITAKNDFVGINFLESRRSTLSESEISGNEFIGAALVETTATRLSNTTIETTAGNESVSGATSAGIYLNGSDARLEDVTTANNDNWTIFAERESNLDATHVSLDETRLSFVGTDIALDSTRRPPLPSHPTKRVAFGRSLVISRTTAAGMLDAQFEYDRRAVSDADVIERKLRLWRYDGNWSPVCDSRIDTDHAVVSATLSRPDRAVFTVLGERGDSGPNPGSNAGIDERC
ncbi:right-handed parallel beta-helix repeat-containing protein [Haladaptatus caseinilyticus]|uniref:right-handed parallel beta-helix repeat-containing protein n=1 Tax=Haladaptatus caseinilyticus TaxID=2993314 RepID=UPI00224B7E11|nr:right-handed parallel beta-helix repeat-containing protein [Haladaptatus caseinilyticus]